MGGDFLIDFFTRLAGADQEARAPHVWENLLPMLGDWYAGGSPFAAALWLADDDEGHRYTLWLTYNSIEKRRTPRPYCISVVSDSSNGQALQAVFEHVRDLWVSQRFEVAGGTTVAVPLRYQSERGAGSGAGAQTLGAVSLFGVFPGVEQKAPALEVAARIAGSWLRLNREARITRALTDLQDRCRGVRSTIDLAHQIGEILKIHASAHVKWQVLVPNGARLIPLAAWQSRELGTPSVTRIQPTALLYRFHFDEIGSDDQVIIRVNSEGNSIDGLGPWEGSTFHDITGDEANGEPITILIYRLRDRMAIAVGGGDPPVIATFLLISGPSDQFVGGHFSQTNLRIVDHISDYFRTSYSALLERERMATINDTIVKFTSAPDMMDDEADLAHLRAFAQVTQEVIPSVTDAVIVENRLEPRHRRSYYRSDGRESIRPRWLSQPISPNRIMPSSFSPDRYLLSRTIRRGGRRKKSFHLVMELSSPSLSLVEETLLERIVAEILATMNLHLDQEKWAIQLAEVRHNLRSIVMSLLGKTARIVEGYEAAREGPPDVAYDRLVNRAAFHKAMAQLKYASEELRALTENIRTISGGRNRISLQINSIDLPELITECIGLFSEETDRRSIVCDFDNRLPFLLRTVDGDRGWLHILFFNLIENAVKYSRQREHIELRLWAHGPFWRFSVTNIGKHIPKHLADTIFEPYVRIDPEPGEQAMPGTGIGLASVKTIAELHQAGDLPPPGGRAVTVNSELIAADSQSLQTARTVFTVSVPRKLKGVVHDS